MPRYDVDCPKCGIHERFKIMDARHDPCDTCGGPIELLFTSSTPSKGFEAYFDMGLGVEVTGIGDRKVVMRREKLDYRDHPSPGEMSARRDKANERFKADTARRHLRR